MKFLFHSIKAAILVVILGLPETVAGQAINITATNVDLYPRIQVYVAVRNQGNAVCDLAPSQFKLTEKKEDRNLRVITGRMTETSMVLLMDESGSMGSLIGAVKKAAANFIDLLGDNDRTALYSFASNTIFLNAMQNVADANDKAALKSALKPYGSQGGGTELYGAVQDVIAKELAAEKGRRKAIIALTDGASGGSLAAAISAAEAEKVAIYSIGMGDVDRASLTQLSEQTGGKFYQLSNKPSQEQLNQVYRDIKSHLDCQYTLIFETGNNCQDGTNVPIEVSVPSMNIFKAGDYQRPKNLKHLDLNVFFEQGTEALQIEPIAPVECEIVQFAASVRATSCSDTMTLENVTVRAFDVTPGDRVEVGRSQPVVLKSNGEAKTAIVEWDTRNFRNDRQIELVLDSGEDALEQSEEDNFLRTKVTVDEMTHDLFVDSVTYEPNPAAPCDTVTIRVKIDDATSCKGVSLPNIDVEARDGKNSLGKTLASVVSGTPYEMSFDWFADGFIGQRPITILIDPDRVFADEHKTDNNVVQEKIEVAPIQHDLAVIQVNHAPKKPFEGDGIEFLVEVTDQARCPDYALGQDVRLRLKDRDTNRVLAHSEPFGIKTAQNKTVVVIWKTKLNDAGDRRLGFELDPDRKIREPTTNGRENNELQTEVAIAAMPHDLIIEKVTIEPETLVDGQPALMIVTLKDDARFPDVKLSGVVVQAFERYSGILLGSSEPADIYSQKTLEVRIPLDTGGMAGKGSLKITVDPNKAIPELTPAGLDGENNNDFHKSVTIVE